MTSGYHHVADWSLLSAANGQPPVILLVAEGRHFGVIIDLQQAGGERFTQHSLRQCLWANPTALRIKNCRPLGVADRQWYSRQLG